MAIKWFQNLFDSGFSVPLLITVVVGTLSAAFLRFFSKNKSEDTALKSASDPTSEKPQPAENVPQAELPEDGLFTIESLATFDGITGPICLGVCGKVVNVSTSENIQPGEGYGKLWAGKDATYALATLSLKPEHANILDFKLSDFTEDQHKALAGWYKHFTTKYSIVGTLKEYDGWDFSSVEKEAETQTPFASSNAGDKASEPSAEPNAESTAGVAPAAEPKASARQDGDLAMLRVGDQVTVEGLKARPELNGAVGVLKAYLPEKGRFQVEVKGERDDLLLRPSNITKVPSADS